MNREKRRATRLLFARAAIPASDAASLVWSVSESEAHRRSRRAEMLQNEKAAPISGGFKSFVCVRAARKRLQNS